MYSEQEAEEARYVRTIIAIQELENLLNVCEDCMKCGCKFLQTGDELYCEICESNPQRSQYL